MSIAEKLTTIADNVANVYAAGANVPTFEEELAAKTELEDAILTRNLTEYTNDRIKIIGAWALAENKTLQSINVPAITQIAPQGVYGCTALTSFYAPLAVAAAYAAFRGCTSLQKVDFPVMNTINSNAFYGCSALDTLILRNAKGCILGATAAFTGTPIESGTGYVYVPDDLVEIFKTTSNWAMFADQIKPISELEGEA